MDCSAPKYSNEMRDQMVKDFATNPFKFYNMTDVEYMDIFNLTKIIYDLVFLMVLTQQKIF